MACGIQIEKQLNSFDGRVLTAPTVRYTFGQQFLLLKHTTNLV
jgi:hypothetical protein